MFKHYLVSAVRSLKRHKLFTLLNIAGLATGMACSVLILLWVQDEYSYDRFNSRADKLYRVTSKLSEINVATSPMPIGKAAKSQLPAVKNYARIVPLQSIVTVAHKKFDEKQIYYADREFLKMFDYPLLQGDKNSLSRPDGVILTAAIANKYFGRENVLGKTIHIDDDIQGHDYTVTGILKNIPHNSHLQFTLLLPISVFETSSNYNPTNGWSNFDVYTYLELNDGTNTGKLETQLTAIHKANDKSGTKTSFTLQPLKAIHLQSSLLQDVEGQGSILYVNIFSLVALFILLIACINFMNLSTALAGQRAKEVGLRKTVGALRFQLIIQFMSESFMLATFSLLIGTCIAGLLLSLFNDIAAKEISVGLINSNMIWSLLGIAVAVGILSGSYPAFFLSSFRPVKVLKGIKMLEGQKNFFRNGLVIAQFTISVVLIISTLIINNQLQFIRNRNIGFNKENLMYLQMPQTGDLHNNYEALKGILNGQAGSIDYTILEHLPTDLSTATTDVSWTGKDPSQQIVFPNLGIDANFIKTFGMQITSGRTFNNNAAADQANFVLNETAVKTMGLNIASAVGQNIAVRGKTGQIIGVVKDFNFKPVQKTIEPLILKYTGRGGFVVIRTTPTNIKSIISKLEEAFQSVYPDFPFTYGFVDQDLSRLYMSEQQMSKLFNVFSVVSIIISCLGLFGLATFATQRRLKEIGVRRVLGASATGIVKMLAGDFIKLVLVALLIAFPLSWWAMDKWLEAYAYRIPLSPWTFLLSGLLAIVVAFITISYQSIKAALSNPVSSLRND
jgi:putative ABC transport system permease protein